MLFIRGLLDIFSISELQKSRLMLYKTNNECIRLKMKCSIQLGCASLNRTFHLSPHENISTIALITIHYLYNMRIEIIIKVEISIDNKVGYSDNELNCSKRYVL